MTTRKEGEKGKVRYNEIKKKKGHQKKKGRAQRQKSKRSAEEDNGSEGIPGSANMLGLVRRTHSSTHTKSSF